MKLRRTAITKGEIPMFKKLVAEGYAPKSIARRMDIHPQTVLKFFGELKVDPSKNAKKFPEDAQFERRLMASDNVPLGANTGSSRDTVTDQISNETEKMAPKNVKAASKE